MYKECAGVPREPSEIYIRFGAVAVVKRNGTVVVADADVDNRELAADALRRAGYETVEVGTGAALLDAVRAGGVALVLLEVALPDVTGYEVCRDLRVEYGEDLPIFFL